MNEIVIAVNFDNEKPTVSGRELHAALMIETPYHKWFLRMCDYGFVEGRDFNLDKNVRVQIEGKRRVSREVIDHRVTIDMAKELCMIQRSEIGKKIRQYFIDVENQWNSPEAIMGRALKIANETINNLNAKIAGLLPKATAYDAVMATFDSVSYRDFCNKIRDTFGAKENDVRDYLIERRLIYRVNDLNGKTRYKPYKETIDRGLMIVKDTPCNDGKVRPCNYFTYKGQQMLIDHFAPTVALDNPA